MAALGGVLLDRALARVRGLERAKAQPSCVNGFGKGLPRDVEFLGPVLISIFKRIFTSSEFEYQTRQGQERTRVPFLWHKRS